MISSGAPALTAASRITRAASTVHCLARGWGLMMMALRVLRAMRHLKIAVLVGLVVGMIPAMRPLGSAILAMPNASSTSMVPQVFSSLYLWKMYSAAKWFLMTLSSTIPMPVSSTAMTASAMRSSLAAMAAARNMASTCSWE